MMQGEPEYRHMLIAMLAAMMVLLYWQHYIHEPRRVAYENYLKQVAAVEQKNNELRSVQVARQAAPAEQNPNLTRAERLALSSRLPIDSERLHGSIALKGARFDDLTLARYHVDVNPESPEVILFSPNGDAASYFAQLGWIASDGTKVPDDQTLWKADQKKLSPTTPVTLSWDNGAGVVFQIHVSLDQNYMFTFRQSVVNSTSQPIEVAPYGFINRAYDDASKHLYILHEGPLAVVSGKLEEIQYEDLREKGAQQFSEAKGWLGITDKYWLAAMIPDNSQFQANFSHYQSHQRNRYQVDYTLAPQRVEPGKTSQNAMRLFAGAKEIKLLDYYAKGDGQTGVPPIELFDRAVDFGALYFLTKPLFLMLNYFYALVGNFGVAIMLLTIVVKLVLFPLANKSYKTMARMKLLTPEIKKINERYAEDMMGKQKALMDLYKRERINPAAGCLPFLIQMPIFFALYKVLFVTIEMRHAPFFGWIVDLSAADPANIFTLFGVLDWNPPGFLHIGVLPILYCISMIIQMRRQPQPTDPVQAKVMAFMPYFLLVIMAPFAAGLLLYWTWSNILSIIQQELIYMRHGRPERSDASPANQ